MTKTKTKSQTQVGMQKSKPTQKQKCGTKKNHRKIPISTKQSSEQHPSHTNKTKAKAHISKWAPH